MASIKHFLANEWDRRHMLKRNGGIVIVSIDADAESRCASEPADPLTPETLFDRRWALTVFHVVMSRLKEEFVAAGKAEQFEALKAARSGERTPYAELVCRLRTSEGAVKIGVHRLQARYRKPLREEISKNDGVRIRG